MLTDRIKRGIEKVEEIYFNGFTGIISDIEITYDGIVFEIQTETKAPTKVKYSPKTDALYIVPNWKER